MEQPARILVVDDELDVLEVIRDQLAVRGYAVQCAGDPISAAEFLTPALTDVAVLDVGAKGLRLAREAASRNIPFILISGRPVVIEMGGLGEVLRKPFRSDELITRIERRLRDMATHAPRQVS